MVIDAKTGEIIGDRKAERVMRLRDLNYPSRRLNYTVSRPGRKVRKVYMPKHEWSIGQAVLEIGLAALAVVLFMAVVWLLSFLAQQSVQGL